MMNKRKYFPREIWGDRFHPDKFERHSTTNRFVEAPCPSSELCRECGFHHTHPHGIIVAIGNAYRGDGITNTRAAYGVYFNIASPLNVAGVLDAENRDGKRAEFATAIEAFRACLRVLTVPEFGEKIKQVVIKTHSLGLVGEMTMNAEYLRSNDFRDPRGQPVANAGLLRSLDNLVCDLEKVGLDVRFWHVPRVRNKQAVKLADAVLNGVDYTRFTRDDLFDERDSAGP